MRRQSGFSLIEALIALLVLSLGLVGVAAMQLKALQSATAGYQRSVATLAAVDAQERLWAELASLGSGQNCSSITVSNATTLQENGDEPSWNNYWFGGNSQTPIRNFDGVVIGSQEEPSLNDCEFRIVIDFDPDLIESESEIFTYNFRLPEL